MIRVGIVGATGYTGIELLRLLKFHPRVQVTLATTTSQQGEKLSQVHPQFEKIYDLVLEELDLEKVGEEVDLAFCALPHGQSLEKVPGLLDRGIRVIDLSADFRLRDPEDYLRWYGYQHPRPGLLGESVYGLPEIYRDRLPGARLVANPGCYPTSVILGLKPLLEEGLVDVSTLVVDSKSGASGAGRSPSQAFHFAQCTENFKAYRVANHQHTPEIEQELSYLYGNKDVVITFTPHLVPMVRGILSTVYARLAEGVEEKDLEAAFQAHYGEEMFIRLREKPALPETRQVYGTNFVDIAFRVDPRTRRVIVITAIDNLVKGAAGQAIQNMNVLLGWPEDTGLLQPVVYP